MLPTSSSPVESETNRLREALGLLLAVVRTLVGLDAMTRRRPDSFGIDLRVGGLRRPGQRGNAQEKERELVHIGFCGHGHDLFSPSTICAAPALLPLRISLIRAMVSCSTVTFCFKAPNSAPRAATLAGSAFTAARVSAIA